MTATLPDDIRAVFERFITAELTTLDERGHPITWPVTPYYTSGAPCIDVTTGLGYPKKANDARRNAHVSLLFSDPTGSGLADAPAVLVQGTAEVDDRDLDSNAERYARESAEKLPGAFQLPPALHRFFGWYYKRIYVHVRPERVYAWPGADIATEPVLYDCHMEEVRSGHDEEPDARHVEPAGGPVPWDDRIEELGSRYTTAALSFVAPDGFPFAIRVPISVDREAELIRIDRVPVAAPFQPGVACLAAHAHDERFTWQRNFHVRGDLVESNGSWALVPHKLVGGFELPPGPLARLRENSGRMLRFRRRAKRELAKRA